MRPRTHLCTLTWSGDVEARSRCQGLPDLRVSATAVYLKQRLMRLRERVGKANAQLVTEALSGIQVISAEEDHSIRHG